MISTLANMYSKKAFSPNNWQSLEMFYKSNYMFSIIWTNVLFIVTSQLKELSSADPTFSLSSLNVQHTLNEPLIITPLLQSGHYLEAQKRSLVPSIVTDQEIISYSAFVNINNDSNVNLQFWFHPKQNDKNWKKSPLVLVLQGGFGLTTLRGALQEYILPYNTTEDSVIRYFPHGLTQHVNVLSIDNTNVGFSFTSDPNYFIRNYDMIVDELYSVLEQFFQLFPDLSRKLYIVGASAAVHKIIKLAKLILNRNRTNIDVAGIIVGDGSIDLNYDMSKIGDYFYNYGMIPKSVARNVTEILDKMKALTLANKHSEFAETVFNELFNHINPHIGYKGTESQDIMKAFRFKDYWLSNMEDPTFRNKLHVGQLPFTLMTKGAEDFLLVDGFKSLKTDVEFILNNKIPFLKFNGQYDGLMSYQSTSVVLKDLEWSGQFCVNSPRFRRKIVLVSHKLFGYIRNCYNLWDMLVISAAHVVQLSKPKSLWNFVSYFIQINEII